MKKPTRRQRQRIKDKNNRDRKRRRVASTRRRRLANERRADHARNASNKRVQRTRHAGFMGLPEFSAVLGALGINKRKAQLADRSGQR